MGTPPERYEPLPGLFGLPAYLLRRLSPRGRRIAAACAAVALVGLVALAVVLVPRISDAKREDAAAERREREQAAARLRAELIAEQRPRRGRVSDPSGLGDAALLAAIERAITRDVRERAASGELDNPARSTDCRVLERGRRQLLACTAITSAAPGSEDYSGVIVGYSYRAAVTPASGRFAFCKASGRPAVGFSARELREVSLPRVCGG